VTALKGVRILESFTPTTSGAQSVNSTIKTNVLSPQSSQAYVTFGVGFSTQELNDQLAPSELFTLGAAHGEVSVAGGWAQNAGHSPLSPKYGLGADQPVEYKVVTADGELKVANAVSNPDLFWALRGGGGGEFAIILNYNLRMSSCLIGTFGVVVESTIKAYPSPPIATSQFWINTTDYNDRKSIYPAAAWLHSKFPEFAEKGLSSFYYVYPNAISLYSMNSGAEGTREWMDANWKPVLQKMGSMAGMSNKSMSYRTATHASYKAFFDSTWGPIGKPLMNRAVGETLVRRHGPGEMGMATKAKGLSPMDSWLFSAEHLKSPDFAKTLEEAMPNLPEGQMRGQLIGGGKVHTLGNDTSVLPAWRKTIAHIVLTGVGHPSAAAFRKFATNMGAYANEASTKTPNWKTAFWGSNYERLSAIKKKYDPTHLFWVTPGIDADAWSVKDGRLCRTTQTGQRTVSGDGDFAPENDNTNVVDQIKDDETRGAPFPSIIGPNGTVIVNPAILKAAAAAVSGLLAGLAPTTAAAPTAVPMATKSTS
jgi:hypothetical protein